MTTPRDPIKNRRIDNIKNGYSCVQHKKWLQLCPPPPTKFPLTLSSSPLSPHAITSRPPPTPHFSPPSRDLAHRQRLPWYPLITCEIFLPRSSVDVKVLDIKFSMLPLVGYDICLKSYRLLDLYIFPQLFHSSSIIIGFERYYLLSLMLGRDLISLCDEGKSFGRKEIFGFLIMNL